MYIAQWKAIICFILFIIVYYHNLPSGNALWSTLHVGLIHSLLSKKCGSKMLPYALNPLILDVYMCYLYYWERSQMEIHISIYNNFLYRLTKVHECSERNN